MYVEIYTIFYISNVFIVSYIKYFYDADMKFEDKYIGSVKNKLYINKI